MALSQLSKKERIGFIGLEGTGGLMARSMLIAGERVIGFDTHEEAKTKFSESGGLLTRTHEELVRVCPVVFANLADPATFVDVAETRLVPHAHARQVFVHTGTATPRETRRFAKRFARKGATLLDAPVVYDDEENCGGVRIFVGGEPAAFERIRPLLEIVGNAEHIKYCGASGSGQVVMGVERLAQDLVQAALLECLAYGVNAGVRMGILRESVGGADGWRAMLSELCEGIDQESSPPLDAGVEHYPLFLDEARDKQFSLPITRALHMFLRNADKTVHTANGESPSLWRELTHALGMGHTMAAKRAAKRASNAAGHPGEK